MEGIQNLYENSTQFIQRYYSPKNTDEFIKIGVYLLVTFYLTDYFMNFRLFKWIYLGTIIILLASWYKTANVIEKGKPFKLGSM